MLRRDQKNVGSFVCFAMCCLLRCVLHLPFARCLARCRACCVAHSIAHRALLRCASHHVTSAKCRRGPRSHAFLRCCRILAWSPHLSRPRHCPFRMVFMHTSIARLSFSKSGPLGCFFLCESNGPTTGISVHRSCLGRCFICFSYQMTCEPQPVWSWWEKTRFLLKDWQTS